MRLGLIPYLVLIGALCAAQYGAVVSLEGSNPIMSALIALQLLKVPIAAARARDLGYDADEAVLAMLPIGNLALFWKLLATTPSESVRAERQAVHPGESTAWTLVMHGLGSLGRHAAVVLPACLVVGLADAALTELVVGQVETLAELPGETLTLYGQVVGGATLLLLLYTVIQLPKRATASRASWFPAVFLPTGIGLGIALSMLGSISGAADPQQSLLIGVIFIGFATMPVFAIGGAWAAGVAQLAARAELRGERAGFELWGASASRLTEVAAPHAGVRYLITIGLQIFVLPGLMYAMQYALVDQVAWEEPEARALRRASELSRGHRQRVLRALLIVGVVVGLGMLAVGVADLGDFAKLSEVAVNPFALSTGAAIVGGGIYALGFAVFELAMAQMYAERVAATTSAAEPVGVDAPDADNVFEPPAAEA